MRHDQDPQTREYEAMNTLTTWRVTGPALRLSAVLALALGSTLTPRPSLAQGSVEKLQPFPLDQVQITDVYQTNLFEKDLAYILTTLDAERLTNGFKAVSTNTTPANLYGGWENSLIRGHTMGHWLSAMAHAYQQTKGGSATLNAQIKTKLDRVISLLKSYQLASGFLFATPMDQFGAPEGQNVSSWVPWYTMHKILSGLVDVAKYGDSADALAVASKLGDWIHARASGWDSATRSRVLGMEYGGMNDCLYELYKLTKNANHLTAAHLFDETNLFTTTAAGTDTLSGKHANTTIPKFIGALNRYRTLGAAEQSYLTAAEKFLEIVLKSHTYVTGGNSQDEHFHGAGQLDQYRDNVNNETCNSYNMSKLTRDLFMVTGDVKYADYYERVHVNEILSSINPSTGMTTYFKAMGTGYFKVFSSATDHFWCCTGTGMENFTRLGDSAYFHDDKDLWVTYYVSSTLDWRERGLALTQTTELPLTNQASFTITAAPTDEVAIKLRKPYWTSTCQVGVSVNGQAVAASEAGGFITVSRVWQANDELVLTFPLFVQYSRLPDNQNVVAFTYGPLVLSAGLGNASMTTASHGVQVLKATRPAGLQETIAINSGTTVNAWLSNLPSNLVQTPGKLEFTLKNTDSDGKLVFVPHYSRYQDRYGIYWKLSGAAGGTATPAVVCPTGTGGTGGSGGATGIGGSTGSGGRSGAGGASARGGSSGSGGGTSSSSGGTAGSGGGGAQASGGQPSFGGNTATATGGSARGGTTGSAGGAPGSGGVASGGTVAGSGGTVAGSGGTAQGGASGSASGGAGGSASTSGRPSADGASGCACSLGDHGTTGNGAVVLLLAFGLLLVRRRR